MSVIGSLVKSGRTEITDKLRRGVNGVVKGYVDQGVAEVIPGVVFIEEVRMLDMECFTPSSSPHWHPPSCWPPTEAKHLSAERPISLHHMESP